MDWPTRARGGVEAWGLESPYKAAPRRRASRGPQLDHSFRPPDPHICEARANFVLERGRAMALEMGEKGAIEVEMEEKGAVKVEQNLLRILEENLEKEAAAAKQVPGGDMITLKSSDEKLFKVSAAAARLSKLLDEMIEGGCAGDDIHLNQIGSRALGMVVDYCNKHANSDSSAAAGSSRVNTEASKDLEEWDHKLVGSLSQTALFELINAAHFLNIDGLLDVTCRKVAVEIANMTPDQIRAFFHIKNDFTKEEEEEILREHAWAFSY